MRSLPWKNAPDLKPEQFTAMTRLDHNRALSQLATKTDSQVSNLKKMIVWGNHSSTQVPDLNHATVDGKAATEPRRRVLGTGRLYPYRAEARCGNY